MPGQIVESNVYALWITAQTAKGSPAAAIGTGKRLLQVAGDIDTNREDGSENWSDLDRFGDATDFVNSLSGSGTPTIEAQANEVAYLCWLFFGTETFTAKVASTSAPVYYYEPGSTTGKWATAWKRVGASTIFRRKFNDVKITSLRFEGSTANKVVKIIPTLLSLDPGEVFTADPATDVNRSQVPFIYTEGAGRFAIDTVVVTSHSQFAVVFDDGLSPYFGDGARPDNLVPGTAGVRIEGVTVLLDDDTLQRYNQIVYGSTAPAAGAKPLTTVPVFGSYEFDLQRGATDARLRLRGQFPRVKWSPDIAIAPNPDGGAIEVALAGEVRKQTGAGPFTAPANPPKHARITVETGAGDNTAHT